MSTLNELLQNLQAADPQTRIDAIMAIGEHEYNEATPHLAGVLRDDIDMGVRYQAALTLGKFADPATTDDLLAALREDSMWLRLAATNALIQIGMPAATGLVAALADQNKAVRRAAAKALGKIGAPQATDGLRRALLDHDIEVRRFAAQALGRIGDAGTLDALSDGLRDDAKRVRRAAAHALTDMGEPGLSVLREAVNDIDPHVSLVAIVTLKAYNDSSAQ